MTHRERFVRTLLGQEVDRVPFIKLFGGDNAVLPRWKAEHPGIEGDIDRLLQFEGPYRGWQVTPVEMGLAGVGEPEITPREDGYLLCSYADGSQRIVLPDTDFHGQLIAWPVKDRADWARVKTRYLDPDDPARFPADWAARVRDYRERDYPLALSHGGVYGFIRNLMGDEALAYAFYDDPELVHDIMDDYTGMVLQVWEKMVAVADFDLIEFWEDMASKNGSLVSPATFRAFLQPNYRRVAAFAAERGIPIILVDSDGLVEELSGLMHESGVTAMYPYEVGAGNDAARVRNACPRLGMLGGLEKNAMAQGKDAIDREMEKACRLIEAGRYIPGPDHFALSNVSFEHYRYFMQRLREVVMSTRPGAVTA